MFLSLGNPQFPPKGNPKSVLDSRCKVPSFLSLETLMRNNQKHVLIPSVQECVYPGTAEDNAHQQLCTPFHFNIFQEFLKGLLRRLNAWGILRINASRSESADEQRRKPLEKASLAHPFLRRDRSCSGTHQEPGRCGLGTSSLFNPCGPQAPACG